LLLLILSPSRCSFLPHFLRAAHRSVMAIRHWAMSAQSTANSSSSSSSSARWSSICWSHSFGAIPLPCGPSTVWVPTEWWETAKSGSAAAAAAAGSV
jgi:hypothetical protein